MPYRIPKSKFLLFNAVFLFIPFSPLKILGITDTMTASEIITLANTARQTNGLAPLHPQAQLMQAAEAKGRAMIAANTWSHNTPTETPWDFIDAAGYIYTSAGENLARDFTKPEDVINAWLNSPSHRENLLNPDFTDTGVAVITGTYQQKQNTTLVVEYLAKAYDPAIGQTAVKGDMSVPPIIINTVAGLSPLVIIIEILASLLIIVLFIMWRLNLRPHPKKRPASSYWRH